MANSVKKFKFLRGLYDEYRAKGGIAVGAWIDGKYDSAAETWHCESNGLGTTCPPDMPWTYEEPNNVDDEKCIIVWFTRTDGVANYRCNEKMPAICATFR